MAKKKSRGKKRVNQSAAIRALLDEGIREPAELKEQMSARHRVNTNPGLIANVKSGYLSKPTKKKTVKRRKKPGRKPRAAAAGTANSLDAAVAFVKAAGGLNQARSALKRIEEIKKL